MAIPAGIKEAAKRDPVRLVIVDDHTFMRDLKARTLGQQSGRYVVLAAVGTAAEAIAACRKLKPEMDSNRRTMVRWFFQINRQREGRFRPENRILD